MLSGGGKRTLGMNNSRMISGALSGQTPVPDPGGYIAFAEIGAALWRRKWTVLAASLGGLALGLAAGWLQRPVYRAAGAIEIQIPNDDYLNRRQLDPSVKPGPILMEQFLQTELRLLQSDTLFREVVTTLSLASHPEFNRPPGLLSRGMQRSSPVSPTATGQAQGPLLDEFRDRVEVRMIGQTQIAEVSFEAGDPELAATVVNRLIDRYRRQSLRRRAATAGETADLLAGQLTELENGLENTQGRLRSFIARERVVGSLDRETIAEAKMRQLHFRHTAVAVVSFLLDRPRRESAFLRPCRIKHVAGDAPLRSGRPWRHRTVLAFLFTTSNAERRRPRPIGKTSPRTLRNAAREIFHR